MVTCYSEFHLLRCLPERIALQYCVSGVARAFFGWAFRKTSTRIANVSPKHFYPHARPRESKMTILAVLLIWNCFWGTRCPCLRPEATQAEREHGPRAFCSLVGAQKIKTKMAERRSKRVATAAIKKVDGPKQAKKPKHEDNGVNLVTAFLHFLFLWGVDTPSSTAGPLIYFFSPVSHPAARRLQQT